MNWIENKQFAFSDYLERVMITGIHHLSIIASSEDSVAFYSSLGFSEVLRKERGYDTVVLMEGHGVGLEIYIDPSHPKRADNPEHMGFRSIAIKVDSCEEIKKHFDCGSIQQDWFGKRYCYTADPDGLPIQFHE